MAKKLMSAREKGREKLLLGTLLLLLPTGIRSLKLDLGVWGLFIGCLGLVGVGLLITGVVGLIKNPKS